MIARLASRTERESAPYRAFMERLDAFAQAGELRRTTNMSKSWEYPWLWAHGLGNLDWTGKTLVDLGSEISPLPWFAATLGARVTLIETDAQWVPRWEALRDELEVDVSWRIVDSETLPLPDDGTDVLTSFSVIEHQPDKRRAVDEVARVLRPGGMFAVSCDICEESMGMTFPAWNGRALTMRAFEELFWRHPAFAPGVPLEWNLDDIPEYWQWHQQTAPHHNYVTGAAVFAKRR